MDTVTLGTTGRTTTRLGFGCGSVMGVLGWADSMRMLEIAFDAGIRHFDVAPAYGYGEAERCLGAFIARHPGQVTVASKFGIPAAKGVSVKGLARKLARPLLKAIPDLKVRLPSVAAAVAHTDTFVSGPNPIFTAGELSKSIDNSLAALRVDHLDLLLLHEARSIDLSDEAMLRLLEDMVAAGKVGAFGVGSEGSKIPALLACKPAYCRVLQYEWSVMDRVQPYREIFRLHHRSLTRNVRSIHARLLNDTDQRRRWSEECGADIGNADVLAGLMLKAAMLCNPDSVILFSSKQRANIMKNAKVASNNANSEQVIRFYRLVQAEYKDKSEASRPAGACFSPFEG